MPADLLVQCTNVVFLGLNRCVTGTQPLLQQRYIGITVCIRNLLQLFLQLTAAFLQALQHLLQVHDPALLHLRRLPGTCRLQVEIIPPGLPVIHFCFGVGGPGRCALRCPALFHQLGLQHLQFLPPLRQSITVGLEVPPSLLQTRLGLAEILGDGFATLLLVFQGLLNPGDLATHRVIFTLNPIEFVSRVGEIDPCRLDRRRNSLDLGALSLQLQVQFSLQFTTRGIGLLKFPPLQGQQLGLGLSLLSP